MVNSYIGQSYRAHPPSSMYDVSDWPANSSSTTRGSCVRFSIGTPKWDACQLQKLGALYLVIREYQVEWLFQGFEFVLKLQV